MECTFTIAPKMLTATINGTVSKVYDGTTDVPAEHTLEILLNDADIIAGDTVSVSNVKYCYETADVGETTIIAEITIDNSNYVLAEDTISAEIGNIEALDISNAEITLGESLTYNVQEQTQEIASIVVDGITLTSDDYSVSGNTGTNANTYTLTITGKGNFTGTATAEWNIAAVEVEELGASLTNILVYNGEEQTQQIELTYLDKVLEEGVDYTLTGNTATDTGTYTIYAMSKSKRRDE